MTNPTAPFLLDAATLDFPDVSLALKEPDGLLAIGGDLSPERLLKAYQQGIFPWYDENQPIMWWSPNPRTILYLKDFHVSQSLKKALKKSDYLVKFDTAFQDVIKACAQPRKDQPSGTWITPEMIEAYQALFERGYAHSIEIFKNNQLIGGVYGVSIGRNFFAESMFSFEKNASKIALYYLAEHLKKWQFEFIDCQVWSLHLATLGATTIPRTEFTSKIQANLASPSHLGKWTISQEIHKPL